MNKEKMSYILQVCIFVLNGLSYDEIGNSDWYHKDIFEIINKKAGDKLI